MKIAKLALLTALLATTAAQADPADFYRGKNINLVVGYGPGGGYDLFARLLARFMPNHMPGKPSVVVQNMPGAASLRATNYLAVAAPKDGTVIAAFDRNMPLIAVIGGNPNVNRPAETDVARHAFRNSTEDSFTLFMRKRPDVKAIEDLRRPGGPQITVGVTSAGATDHDVTVVEGVLGLNIKLIPAIEDFRTPSDSPSRTASSMGSS